MANTKPLNLCLSIFGRETLAIIKNCLAFMLAIEIDIKK